ncbi:MAG TPA: 30S ribosomal protein S12 methylthiotransferase RimO, partial [Acidimicrobiaceae bacterium]|nr:30S ribosomal protein S12 methylthiotransferase RimO [Acidimicrobiaceae bacterium]
VGYPGETEHDQDELLEFVSAAQLDWCGFFEYSAEESTHAATLADQVPEELRSDRIAELRELQDGITAARRDSLIGTQIEVLVDAIGEARSFREAPEIDGIVQVPEHLVPGSFVTLTVTNALGPDLVAS